MRMRAAVLVMLSLALMSCGKSHPATESRRSQHLGWVGAARLARTETEPDEWVSPGRDAGGTYFSPLSQINEHSVEKLGFAWQYALGTSRGLEATPVVVDGVMFAVGNLGRVYALNAATGANIPGMDFGVERTAASTVVFVAVNEKLAGAFALSDLMKESTPEAIRALQDEGLRIVILTGDRKDAAKVIADKLGIEEVEGGVLPQQKAEIVKRLKSEGRIVAMAGDGINDAPALAAADVGIAMGTGTAVAIENAGITLVKGDLRGIVRARKLSRVTIRNIKQNLLFAFLYNVIGIPIAAGILYPSFRLLLSPMLASAAMSFSSVSVIANALRLRKVSL